MSKGSRNRQAARDKIARMKAAEARRRRRRIWAGVVAGTVAAIAAAVGITLGVAGGTGNGTSVTSGRAFAPISTLGVLRPAPPPGASGPEGVPVPAAAPLTGTAASATGHPVDGISCQTTEQTLFHIHAHLAVFVNGTPRQIPAGIGIPGAQAQNTVRGTLVVGGTCLYWLHTHAADGIIHIESPVRRTYTLGDVFDEWGQRLGPDQVGPSVGHVTAIYDGHAYLGNPRDIPLTAHALIQLEVGRPLIAQQLITFPAGL